ncbi:methyl-CpG-binding domain protein 3-like 2B [Apodemus sylvaticus]|uniref:methyl-CpG-binding domain protein 3-like 2B n=1 Tax=Apodemus sylvaticus TaxID=10129 RepID=UPI0022438634|nr:methyl-CpG-binding domain protein 3-like 2B [Apodemus sylvaticus]
MEGPSGNSVSSQPLIGRLTRSIIPNKLQKRREIQVSLRNIKAKDRTSVTSRDSRRMTSNIFPKPVTIITSYPENKTRYSREEAKLKKPKQLCAFGRLQNYQVESSKEDLSCPLKLTNPVERIALGIQDETNNQSGVKDQFTPGEVTSVQSLSLENTGQVALQQSPSFSSQGVTMPQPLHLLPSYFMQKVTITDIQRQTGEVQKARKRLADALEADRLARQVEKMGEQR